MWGKYDVERIVDLHDGLFLVRFESAEQRDAVCKGLFFFDKKPLIVRAWKPDIVMDRNAIQHLPIWVQFPQFVSKSQVEEHHQQQGITQSTEG